MISAIILTHNSGQTLAKTLESLAWCDERIVVDDYSSDNSVSIAKNHKAKILERRLENNFAAQRNFGLANAKGDWVLFVDSDEVITDELKKEIQAIDSRLRGNDNAVGYFLKRQDYVFGRQMKHGETENVRLLRLAKQGAGVWERPVHEVWRVDGETSTLKEPLLHSPHPSIAIFLDKINYYSTINAQYLYSQKVQVPWWHIIAYPKAKFLFNYVAHMGFLDGTQGMIVALMMSFHSFLTRAKLYLLWHRKSDV